MNKLLSVLASDKWEDKDAENWENQSNKGMTYFLFKYALLIYGSILFLFITLGLVVQIINEASWLDQDKTPSDMIFFNLVVCVIISQIYGLIGRYKVMGGRLSSN